MVFTSSFCPHPLCSVLLSSSVSGTRPWCASGFTSLPEGVRNCRDNIFGLWLGRVTACTSSCGNVQNGSWIWLEVDLGSWMLRAVEVHLGGKAREAEKRAKILKKAKVKECHWIIIKKAMRTFGRYLDVTVILSM